MEGTATTNPLASLGLTTLALRLLRELAETDGSSNLVFSPLSIYAAHERHARPARERPVSEGLLCQAADDLDEFILEPRAENGEELLESRAPCAGGRELAETDGSSNLVFSPLSIYAALALTAAGARGATLQEFLAVLGARSQDELAEIVRGLAEQTLADRSLTGGPRVSFVCGVWHDETRQLKPAFRDAAAQSYKAETRAVDFREEPGEAVRLINAWAAAATNNLIDSILTDGQVSKQTDIIVANAVYFKGMWPVPFDKECTEDDKFHRLDGSTFDVPFMRSWKRQYIACHEGFKVLKLGYKKGRQRLSPNSPFSMCVFLPDARDARDGLPGLISRIASSSSDFIREHLPTSLVTVGEFGLPRFKLTFSGDMSSVLRRLGLQVAFDGKEADLCDMVEDDGTGMPLAVQSIVHMAVIEVNEYGTEAAAATTSRMCTMGAPNTGGERERVFSRGP